MGCKAGRIFSFTLLKKNIECCRALLKSSLIRDNIQIKQGLTIFWPFTLLKKTTNVAVPAITELPC
jgi:hypothetical protein